MNFGGDDRVLKKGAKKKKSHFEGKGCEATWVGPREGAGVSPSQGMGGGRTVRPSFR